MATTSNYGWTTPDDSSLVKDGASAIRALGTAIDTSMNTALGTKKSGLVLLNTTSFSGVAQASLPTNTFTSTYQNYRVMIYLSARTGTGTMRLRTSGTDNSTANYKYMLGMAASYTSGAFSSGVSATGTSFDLLVENADWQGYLDIQSPQIANKTVVTGLNASDGNCRVYGGIFNTTQVFDSLSLLATSITGTMKVYGYND
jgi:hypothetical protein